MNRRQHSPKHEQVVTTMSAEPIVCTPELLASTIVSCFVFAMLLAVVVSFAIVAGAVLSTAQTLDAMVNAPDASILVRLI